MVKKIDSMPTGARVPKEKEKKVAEVVKGCASVQAGKHY